jgi:hypothetical protein
MNDWPSYNESLVRRGQVLLDVDVLDRWDQELFQMNRGKIGEPYCYPDSFIQLLGYMRAYFHLYCLIKVIEIYSGTDLINFIHVIIT